MAFSDTEVCEWTRLAFRTTSDVLPDADLARLITSIKRKIKAECPLLVEEGGSDFSELTGDDVGALEEAIGWWVAADWVSLPRPDGDEQVVRLKIGQIEEAYKLESTQSLKDFFDGKAYSAFSTLSFIGQRDVDSLDSQGLKLVIANPTRSMPEQSPSIETPITHLFPSNRTYLLQFFGGSVDLGVDLGITP